MLDTAAPGFLSIDDYLALPQTETRWLIDRVVPVGGTVLLYAAPKTGKTHLALQMALAMVGSTDGHWMGYDVLDVGPVMYLALDQSPSIWRLTMEKVRRAGFNTGGITFADRQTFGLFPFDVADPAHALYLQRLVARVKPVAVVVDTLRKMHAVDENDASEMNTVLNALVGAVAPASLVIVAHARKPSKDKETDILGDARGSTAVVGEMDTIIRLERNRMTLVGRVLDEHTIALTRDLTTHFFGLDDRDFSRALVAILKDTTICGASARAAALSQITGRSVGYCHTIAGRFP